MMPCALELSEQSVSVPKAQALFSGCVMSEGTIKKLTDKGFGFINTGKAKDLFFHSSKVNGVSFEELREGQRVSFTEGQGPKGPCAENVSLL
jgi:cold shock protein